jgi:uncharacterized ferritin-like protein (DUF455 family)
MDQEAMKIAPKAGLTSRRVPPFGDPSFEDHEARHEARLDSMDPPEVGTVERWAWDYVSSDALSGKLAPDAPPTRWEEAPPSRRLERPGRPPELRVTDRADKTRGLAAPSGRARALHTFLHHELQAAELMAWALLAFSAAPAVFREGLLRIALDEIRHMRLYAEQIERLGYHVGEFPVRDWFWTRVPTCAEPASFVAVMGLGLESANLEHTASFAARFRDAGDEEGARVQELVGLEEIAHVRFGARWFAHFTGDLGFDAWRRALPPPLTPLLMRGKPLHREARRRAGQTDPFIDALEQWTPDSPEPG